MRTDGMSPGDPVAQAPSPTVNPQGTKIVICHWTNGGHWNQIEISINGLNGHDNHRFDIWPPVEGETDGQNWGIGENVWNNECQTTDRPTPTPTHSVPEPTQTPIPTVTLNPSATATQSLPPIPTETVTATAIPTSTPTPEPCPTVTSDAAVVIPLTFVLIGATIWRVFR